jgi:hypothetical protein
MWALDIANKQTFFNHYTFPLGLLVIAVAAATGEQQASDDAPTRRTSTD